MTFRVYTVADLREMPAGTCFEHADLGKCIIRKTKTGTKYVTFKANVPDAWLWKDEYPWVAPMRKLGPWPKTGD